MLEIKFSGRGGQGVVVASQILGLAFFKAGKYPQCYSVFGGERRGAPLVSFLRVDEEKILLKCEIRHPNELICFDDSLIDPKEINEMMIAGGRILINTTQTIEAFKELDAFELHLVNAFEVSQAVGLGKIINTAMVGAYCCLMGYPELNHVLDAVGELAPAKRKANVEAARMAYELITTK